MKTRFLMLALALACGPDLDGDGVRGKKDCDDADPTAYRDAPELCDGIDSNCDGVAELDVDGDGYRDCAECDDTRADVFPGAPSLCDGTDADCDGTVSAAEAAELGDDPACAAATCATLHTARPDLGDGTYWVDGDTLVPAFQVDCDMGSDGGGWLQLSLVGDAVLVGSSSPTNAWYKCADDATEPWPWLPDEPQVPEDYGSGRADVRAPWLRPSDGYVYSRDEVEALGGSVTELHPDIKLVASTNDDDGGTWQDGGGGGLEVYALAADGAWFLLTPGTGGECGGATGWPTADTVGMQYHWSSDATQSWWQGTQSDEADPDLELGALPSDVALPVGFVLATFTGGGVAVGYDRQVIRVR
ncbi:MAG: MopE-related protein [Myxococcota bacterium]